MATVPHVASGSGLRKFHADGFLLDRVYKIYSPGRPGARNVCTSALIPEYTVGKCALWCLLRISLSPLQFVHWATEELPLITCSFGVMVTSPVKVFIACGPLLPLSILARFTSSQLAVHFPEGWKLFRPHLWHTPSKVDILCTAYSGKKYENFKIIYFYCHVFIIPLSAVPTRNIL